MIIEGHCPRIDGLDLARLVYKGITSDHTQQTVTGMKERIKNGMFVEIQEKSLTKEIIQFIKKHKLYEHFCFVTDDVMADSFASEGHLNKLVKKATNYGLKPELAIYAATYTPSQRMNLNDRGSITPGNIADFILIDDLNKFTISEVYKQGKKVYKQGKTICKSDSKINESTERLRNQKTVNYYTQNNDKNINKSNYPTHFYHSIKLSPITGDDLDVNAPISNGKVKCRIIEVSDGTTFTREIYDKLEVIDEYLSWEDSPYCLAAVFERYGKNGNLGVGLVGGDIINKGAIATTYAHDHHNLLAIGKTKKEIVKAVNTLIDYQGGYCVVLDDQLLASVELPVGGILSEQPVTEVGKDLRKIRKSMEQLGYTHYNPVMSLSTISLPVSPELKITDKGLINLNKNKIVNLFMEE